MLFIFCYTSLIYVNLGFGTVSTPLTAKGAAGMRRAGTIIRSPIESRHRGQEKQTSGEMRASEVLFCQHKPAGALIPFASKGFRAFPGANCEPDL